MTYAEMLRMTPGFIMDMFRVRQDYDFQLHHLKREKLGGDWD